MRRLLILPGLLLVTTALACFRHYEEEPPPPEGMYAEQPTVPAGSEPGSLALSDFDGDGNLDLAVASYLSNDVRVFGGAGDGTFSALGTLATEAGPRFLTTGDYDDDGDVDIAVTNRDGGSVSVFWNDGAAEFQSSVLPAANEPVFIGTLDLDEDGVDDLVLTDANVEASGRDLVSVFLAAGDGSFAARADFESGWQPIHATFGDLDEDGNQDVITADYAVPPDVTVLLGDGQGAFGPPESYRASDRPGLVFPIAPRVVDAADVDGDGHQDVMVGNRGMDVLDGEVWMLAGDGTGSLAFPEYVTGTSVLAPGYIKLIDLNDDGHLDFVDADHDPMLATVVGAFSESAYSVCIALGDGAGTFEHATCVATGDYPYEVAFGDLNHDDKLDLAVACAGSNSVSVFLANW